MSSSMNKSVIKMMGYFFAKLKKIYNHIYCLVNKYNDDLIICESYIQKRKGKLVHHNWGDDLNIYLFEFVTQKKVQSIPMTRDKIKFSGNNYLLIGSIIGFYNLDNKIIYGSGILNPKKKVNGKPQRIISVRGPKTRKVLLDSGIMCPEKYGDPVLLLPLFYSPVKAPSRQGSVILNIGTKKENNDIVSKFCKLFDVNIISMTEYDKWTDVIDKIYNSKYVISESLHGLIVAETYGIPNLWVEFIDHDENWTFKFDDYYQSIGKTETIISLQNGFSKDMINDHLLSWQKGSIDYSRLLSYFPFEIKCNINEELLNGNCKRKNS